MSNVCGKISHVCGKNRKCLRAAKVENKVSACTAKRKALLFTHVKTTDPHDRD